MIGGWLDSDFWPPDLDDTEVEIARISIRSTTGDVTSVYAWRGKSCLHYRVVDEYGGDTLTGASERTSEKPLSLGELYEFFVEAWPFMGVLEMNYERDLEGMLGFFSGDSAFYDEFPDVAPERPQSSKYQAASSTARLIDRSGCDFLFCHRS